MNKRTKSKAKAKRAKRVAARKWAERMFRETIKSGPYAGVSKGEAILFEWVVG